MRETRRGFVIVLAVLCGWLATPGALSYGQRRRPMPDPPEPAEAQTPTESRSQNPESKASTRAARLQNEREFRAGVERLYQLSSGLRDEVEKTMTADVLSVHMYKKTEEIEKLARELKAKAKG